MSYSSRVYRQRNPHTGEEAPKEGFFNKKHDNHSTQKNGFFQPKLTINQPGDSYEKEADQVASAVVNDQKTAPVLQQKKISSIQRLSTPPEEEKLGTNEARMARDKEIQEKPIQQMHGAMEKERPDEIQKMDESFQEEDDKKAAGSVQRKQDSTSHKASAKLSAGIENSAGRGTALPNNTLREMGSSFGADFSNVKIHSDSESVKMNKELQAQAFTHGNDIYFNQGKFDPESRDGRSLLAHELTHVVQQRPDKIATKKIGTKFSHTKGAKSGFKNITAQFDGQNFILFGDSLPVMAVPAQSGRPYTVSKKDAAICGGSPSDSYLNNPLYVGIKDNGPIPEGSYKFKASQFASFSPADQAAIILGKSQTFTDPFGKSMHGGDWGAGRVALNKITIKPGKKGCGNTRTRSGFYLHGGIMPGSSGCIDIGNAAITALLAILNGYKGNVTVHVKYTHPAPFVDAATRTLGTLMYDHPD